MASYTFRWPHSANEVYVTGTFDNWAKTEKLEKNASGFEKKVQLSKVEDKIRYKFVVDGNWTTDHLAPSETDESGNVNNILTPEHLSVADNTISSVAPSSTTAALAGQVPLEKDTPSDIPTPHEIPGQFPETPANELFVNPIPATSGAGNPVKLAPGEKVPEPSSYTGNTIDSNVRLDQESYEKGASATTSLPESKQQTYSVKPLPATAGAGNPVHLAPGEKVPDSSSYTAGTLSSNVKLDKESYEKSGSTAPQLPPVLNNQEQREAEGAAIFGIPPVTGTMIPESSLPMGDHTTTLGNPSISSVGPQSTTAQLAGQQPIQPRGVPGVVTDSQQAAHVPAEAASSGQAVQDKSLVEEELKDKVPEAPSTSESGLVGKSEKGYLGAAAGGLAAAGAAVTAAAYAAKDKAYEAAGQPAPEAPSSTYLKYNHGTVPEVVTESQEAAHASPEAASSAQAVQDKSFVEEELKDKVPEAPATTESGLLGNSEKGVIGGAAASAAAAGAAVTGAAYAAKDKVAETTGQPSGNILPVSTQDTDRSVTGPTGQSDDRVAHVNGVPDVVSESQHQAHAAPEASANPEAVREKAAVEKELERKLGSSEDHINGVPDVVSQSQHQAHAAPEASANPEAVREKAAVEQELERKVHPSEGSGAPAPTASAALSSTAPVKTTDTTPAPDTTTKASELQPEPPRSPSRDVSPMTKTSTAEPSEHAAPSTPQKTVPGTAFKNTLNTPDSTAKTAAPSDTASPADSKKSKRRSFFGRLKDKFKS
ncbi:carbohydrate-binding module family 48 protein [Myriangium duriaei CBS 260.36]|uniref:Carbohydrate-binding module family 48 protein n=1 Tax=Myriangium duriaei CBS 260.36 TaxID=1168546 RepID=A0A9P4MFV3_9PEZI|nr:carbohydrate-binding module family 48 protein [Myriangium duriaei CBS 260.36]